jgi:hypothetical protein
VLLVTIIFNDFINGHYIESLSMTKSILRPAISLICFL